MNCDGLYLIIKNPVNTSLGSIIDGEVVRADRGLTRWVFDHISVIRPDRDSACQAIREAGYSVFTLPPDSKQIADIRDGYQTAVEINDGIDITLPHEPNLTGWIIA